ncbi:putative ribonuclease H-like domain-containing protein [Tanacetum coccineum]
MLNQQHSPDARFKPSGDNEKKVTEEPRKEGGDPSNTNDSINSTNNINTASDGNSTNNVNTVSSTVNTTGIEVNAVSSNTSIELPNDPNMPELEDIVYSDDYEDVGAEADMNNLDTFMPTLVDLPNGKRAIGTKWVYRNKKDERGIVIKNKERIEAIRLFLAYASFKDFVVYQMDIKSAFLYGKIEEEVYVCQPLGFEDPDFPEYNNKVEKGTLWIAKQAPRACKKPLLTYCLDNSSMGEPHILLRTASKVKERWDFYQSRQDFHLSIVNTIVSLDVLAIHNDNA